MPTYAYPFSPLLPSLTSRILLFSQKLNTIKRCLSTSTLPSFLDSFLTFSHVCAVEVAKQGGPFTGRDLYPFQMALHQIDTLRKDGKFEGRDGSVPEGQSLLHALLSEAYDQSFSHSLRRKERNSRFSSLLVQMIAYLQELD